MLEKIGGLADSNFTQLRDALCARLTLFNARRGNEATRMTVKHWHDAIQKRWIKKNYLHELDELERKLTETHLITYIRGKGNKDVPVIIPTDCIEGMKALADMQRRQEAGVAHNKYLFACTHQSENHVEGWHCIGQMSREANLPDPSLLNATNQRHRISTMYAALDLTPSERELFYAHMGHSGDMNKDRYQHPLAVKSLVNVGRHLNKFDRSKDSSLFNLLFIIIIYCFQLHLRILRERRMWSPWLMLGTSLTEVGIQAYYLFLIIIILFNCS